MKERIFVFPIFHQVARLDVDALIVKKQSPQVWRRHTRGFMVFGKMASSVTNDTPCFDVLAHERTVSDTVITVWEWATWSDLAGMARARFDEDAARQAI